MQFCRNTALAALTLAVVSTGALAQKQPTSDRARRLALDTVKVMVDAIGASHTLTLGLQTRADFISGVGLFRTQRRIRYGTVREDDVNETGSGVYVSMESRWTPKLRTMVGMRADAYTFDVASSNTENSGDRTAAILSPKASLAYAPTQSTELYLSGGLGFHSNDARGTTITVDPANGEAASQVDPLVRSHGVEAGLRTSMFDGPC